MPEMDKETLAVIAKVEKLLALANNNANEHEAAAASAKAMELLAAYNLDMAVLGKSGKGAQRSDTRNKGGLYGWQRELWRAVAELNFCRYWSIRGLNKGDVYEHRILGSEVNVISTRMMAEYLQQTVERLAREYAKQVGGINIFCKQMIAYREGMACRLAERLQVLRRERMEEEERKRREDAVRARHPGAAPGTALILADVVQTENDLNEDYLNGLEPGTTARRRAERLARQAAAQEAANEALRARDEMEKANPALREERLRREREKEEADRRFWEELHKKWAKAEARRAKRRKGDGFRYRKQTAAEERASMQEFRSGYRKAEEIGLDQQIDKNRTKAVK